MNEQQFRQLLDKYLQGQCNPDETALLHQFYDSFQKGAQQPDSFEMWLRQEKMRSRIRANITQQERRQYQTRQLIANRRRKLVRMAAIVLLLIGLGVGGYWSYEPLPLPEMARMERTTQKGQKATIVLMDGTKVYLNADSKLSFPEKFATDQREVLLEGEAFFEVARNVQRPFIVRSGDLTTTVLGTSFNIKAFAGEPSQVTVATGRVKVNSHNQEGMAEEVFLLPHQQAYFDGHLHKRAVDINQFIAWKDKIIRFDEMSLAEAALMLERWFDVSIVIEDQQAKNCKISGQYINENLINIMESFQYILGIQYRIEDNRQLIIEGKGCQSNL